jgi:putative transposase
MFGFITQFWNESGAVYGYERSMMTGNLQEKAVVESFFQLLKRERVKRRIYRDRAEANMMCSTT